MRPLVLLLALAGPIVGTLAPAAAETTAACRRASGDVARACFADYTRALEDCLLSQDPACEAALRADGGPLETRAADAGAAAAPLCSMPSLDALAYTGNDDLALRVREACADFGNDLIDVAFSPDVASLSRPLLRCQRIVARQLRRLRARIVDALGPDCFAADGRGGATCDEAARDRQVARARAFARQHIRRICRDEFAALGLAPGGAAAQLEDVLDRTVARTRHFAQLVYPPRNLGPTSLPGTFPIGVRTFAFADGARTNTAGNGPRPVVTEVWYPSTPTAVAGVPRDVASVLGVPVAETTSYRNVALAPGTFPLVVFSHGNNGIRIQSIFFAQHLASHGYIVASMDHHGNTFVDSLAGIFDAASVVNRPVDVSFVIDEVLGPSSVAGAFLDGRVDPARIGASGHSFGGYTVFALAGGAGAAGTFTDPRVKAILPQAPANLQSAAFYAGITIPALVVGGSLDETTPFPASQEVPFMQLPSGAEVVGLARLGDAGHFTFSDFCEVPRVLLGFLGGFDEACEPRHLAWRYAHDVVNYLALNFFDAVLRGDAAARARLDPAVVNRIDDLVYVEK
jgi:predicted dienelactone hydrolase